MNGENVEKAYRMSEKRERDRERKRRKAKQGKFEAAFLHVNFEEGETRENSPSWLSDNGKGADDIIAAVDGEIGMSYFQRRLKWARQRIKRRMPECMEVFNLIIENGSNREESICELAKRMWMRKQR